MTVLLNGSFNLEHISKNKIKILGIRELVPRLAVRKQCPILEEVEWIVFCCACLVEASVVERAVKTPNGN